jgi:hypothetical protein
MNPTSDRARPRLHADAPDTGPRLTPERLRHFFVDLALVLAVFAALAALGAVLWHQLVDLPRYSATAQGGSMPELQLTRFIGIDGWFAVIAVVLGLVAGAVLLLLRPAEPVEMVVLVVLGGLFASWLMLKVGLHLGPGDPGEALRHAAAGTTVPVQLRPHATGVELGWSIGAALGALAVLLFVTPRSKPGDQPEHDV